MRFVLLPSAIGGSSPRQFLTSYVINDSVAVDAGSIGFLDDLDRQRSITDIVLTHAHVDHIASLGPFVDNVCDQVRPIVVHCLPEVAETLRQCYLNDVVWPDISRIPSPESPYLSIKVFRPQESFTVAGLHFLPIDVDHTVPTVGFIVRDNDSTVVFGADSGPTDRLWAEANAIGNVKMVVLELSFPNSQQARADRSKHLTLDTFRREIEKIEGSPRIIAVHLKSSCREQIAEEFEAAQLQRCEIVVPGGVYEV